MCLSLVPVHPAGDHPQAGVSNWAENLSCRACFRLADLTHWIVSVDRAALSLDDSLVTLIESHTELVIVAVRVAWIPHWVRCR